MYLCLCRYLSVILYFFATKLFAGNKKDKKIPVNYLMNYDIFICIVSKHPQFVVLGTVSRALGKGDNIASQ